MLEHVFVFSHRRSGTHLTIDAIRNNIREYGSSYLNMDALLDAENGRNSLETIKRSLSSAPRILKSHSHAGLLDFFGNGEAADFVRRVAENGRIIYVYRDGRDVMTSYYHYVRSVMPDFSSISFGTFLRMKDPLDVRPSLDAMTNVEYWNHHVSGWIDRPSVLKVSFESLVMDFDVQVARLSEFLGQPEPQSITNVIRTSHARSAPRSLWSRSREKIYKLYKRHVAGIDLTSVNFRQGRVGAYRDQFSNDDLAYFEHVAGDVLTRLGYDL